MAYLLWIIQQGKFQIFCKNVGESFGDLQELIRSRPMKKRGLVSLPINFIFPFAYFLFYFSVSLSYLLLTTLFLSICIPALFIPYSSVFFLLYL